jgi:hypothetical protein
MGRLRDKGKRIKVLNAMRFALCAKLKKLERIQYGT